MKIFASNFALELRLKPDHGHFDFERSNLRAIKDTLRAEPWFEDRVQSLDYQPEKFENILSLLRNEKFAERRATVVLYFPDDATLGDFFNRLRSEFKPAPAAGGLVTNEKGELLLIERLGKWDLPKGKLDKGEKPDVAALREVEEETGLKHHRLTAPEPILTYHVYLHREKWRFKQTNWYRMVTAETEELEPQQEEGITAVRWWTGNELDTELPPTYPQIEELIREFRFGE